MAENNNNPQIDELDIVIGASFDKASESISKLQNSLRKVNRAMSDTLDGVANSSKDIQLNIDTGDTDKALEGITEDMKKLAKQGRIVKEVLDDIEIPDIEIPNIVIPDIDIPEVEVPEVEVKDVDIPESAVSETESFKDYFSFFKQNEKEDPVDVFRERLKKMKENAQTFFEDEDFGLPNASKNVERELQKLEQKAIAQLNKARTKLNKDVFKNGTDMGIFSNASFRGDVFDLISAERYLEEIQSRLNEIKEVEMFGEEILEDWDEILQGATLDAKELDSTINDIASKSNEIKLGAFGEDLSGKFKNVDMTSFVEMANIASESPFKKMLNNGMYAMAKLKVAYKNNAGIIRGYLKNAFSQSFSKYPENLAKTFSLIGKNALKSLVPIEKLKNKIKDLGRTIKNSRIFRALIYSWINGTVKQITNAIKAAVKEGSDNLVQYSKTYDKTISNMRSALIMLKNAFAVAFSPIITIVEPYITAFIKRLAMAMNYVAQFIGALQGKKIVTQAKDVMEDYGDTLKTAGENAKTLNAQLQGFDKLNNLTTSSGSSSDDGGLTYEDMFTEAEIDANVSRLAEMIKNAWEKDGMHGLGETLRDIVISNLNGIDWDGWEKKAENFGKNVGAFCCGILEPDNDGNTFFGAIGTTIAGAINTALAAFDGWTDAFKGDGWTNLGENMAQMVTNALDENKEGGVKWSQIDSIAQKLGTGVATSLNSFINSDSEPIRTIGKAAAEFIKAGVNGWYSFVKTFDFEKLGSKLAESINSFVSEMNLVDKKTGLSGWETLAKDISGLVDGIETTLFTALKEIDWPSVFKGIKDFFENMTTETWVTLLGAAALKTLGESFGSTVKGKLNNTQIAGVVLLVTGISASISSEGTDLKSDLINDVMIGLGAAFTSGQWWLSIPVIAISGLYSFVKFEANPDNVNEQGETPTQAFIRSVKEWIRDHLTFEETSYNMEKGEVTLRVPLTVKFEEWVEEFKDWIGDLPEELITTEIKVLVKLGKKGWETIDGFVGTVVSVYVSLKKKAWSTISAYIGTLVNISIALKKKGWTTIGKYIGANAMVQIILIKKNWTTISKFIGTTVKVSIELMLAGYKTIYDWIKAMLGGNSSKKVGGVYNSGSWQALPQFASGGVNYGSAFIAGEAGPELVGHIGGRTEVLNQSQLASVMYDAVVSGMTTVMNNYGGGSVSVQIDGREVFNAVKKQDRMYSKANGHSAFVF